MAQRHLQARSNTESSIVQQHIWPFLRFSTRCLSTALIGLRQEMFHLSFRFFQEQTDPGRRTFLSLFAKKVNARVRLGADARSHREAAAVRPVLSLTPPPARKSASC